jgi:beta-N-acetylhexosaminidase
MHTIKKIIVIVIAVCMTTCFLPAGVTFAENSNQYGGKSVEDILDSMTLEQKITQCIMIDFRKWNDAGGKAADMTVLSDEVAGLLADYKFGALILFANNIKKTDETVTLTKDMQAAAMSKGGLPMIMATDQEGGIVYRLGSGTALPGNMAVCATGDSQNAETAGSIIGRELESLGINTTLAPVLDVNSNPSNPVIGLRSFSDDAATVGEYGIKYIEGLNKYNTIGCGKHFPGHGDTTVDSHYGLPEVNKTLDQLEQCELVPFRTAINNGIDMIMTAHILYPLVDDTKVFSEKTGIAESRPATMSKIILTDVLKGDLGFKGVVVTDAMNMKGIADNFKMPQATLEALKAGADMVCMPVTDVTDKDEWVTKMDSVIAKVRKEAEQDDEFAARLDEAVKRILLMKQEKGILDYDPSDYTVERAKATVGSKENRSLEREISAKAVTVIRNGNDILPLNADKDTRILLLTPYKNEKAPMMMGINRAKAAGLVPKETKIWAEAYSPDYETSADELEKQMDWADVVIINSENSCNATSMSYDIWTSSLPKAFTEYCKAHGKKSIVMSVSKPYDVQLYPDADAVMVVYGCKGSNISGMPQLTYGETTEDTNACGPNITAGIEVAFGVFGASGKLPVNVPVFDQSTKSYTDELAYERGYGLSYDKAEPKKPDVPVKPTVKLKKAAIKSLKPGKRKLTVKMTTRPSKKGGTHYQIAYKVKGTKKWKYKITSTAKKTITHLKSKKRYLVKARVYKKVSGKKYYGKWSKIKKSRKIK